MEITKEYLQGVVDALYNSQTSLLSVEIEEEKAFSMVIYDAIDGYIVTLFFTESYIESSFENDLPMPSIKRKHIKVSKDAKIGTVIKSIIKEMEVIYLAECPEIERKKYSFI